LVAFHHAPPSFAHGMHFSPLGQSSSQGLHSTDPGVSTTLMKPMSRVPSPEAVVVPPSSKLVSPVVTGVEVVPDVGGRVPGIDAVVASPRVVSSGSAPEVPAGLPTGPHALTRHAQAIPSARHDLRNIMATAYHNE
jgi:hypothetical protein